MKYIQFVRTIKVWGSNEVERGMSKQTRIIANRLEQAESEFSRWLAWPEANRLRDLAQEIRQIRAGIGERNQLCEQFLGLCGRRGPNVVGEPRLATELLNKLAVV